MLKISPAPSPSSLEFNLKGQKPGNSLMSILRLANNPAKSMSPSCQNIENFSFTIKQISVISDQLRFFCLDQGQQAIDQNFFFFFAFLMLGNAFKLPTDISSVDFAAKQSPKAIPFLRPLPPACAYLPRSAVTGFLKCPQWISLTPFQVVLCCILRP